MKKSSFAKWLEENKQYTQTLRDFRQFEIDNGDDDNDIDVDVDNDGGVGGCGGDDVPMRSGECDYKLGKYLKKRHHGSRVGTDFQVLNLSPIRPIQRESNTYYTYRFGCFPGPSLFHALRDSSGEEIKEAAQLPQDALDELLETGSLSDDDDDDDDDDDAAVDPQLYLTW